MLLKLMSKVLRLLLVLSPVFGPLYAEDVRLGVEEHLYAEHDKVYVVPEQIHISVDGIYVYIDSECILVDQINFDEKGLYILMKREDKITDKCFNGHKIWCHQCGGCVVRYCKFLCICVAWE